MDLDAWVRIGTFTIAVIGGGKIVYDIYSGRTGRAREEYRFAKEFLSDFEGELHPFLLDKGFKALSGNNQITPEEASYLIGLKDPVRALKDFSLGRDYIELSKTMPTHFISFRCKYKKSWSRRWRKLLYTILYFILAMTAFSPLMFSGTFGGIYSVLSYFILFCMIFGMSAVMFLRSAVRIHRAEQLEKNQSRHKQIITVVSP